MANTFDPTQFKNYVLNWLSGQSAGSYAPLYYCNLYNGAQAANPATAPAGTFEFATLTSGFNTSGKWTAADNNATAFLSVSVAPTTPAGAAAVTSLTTARFYNSGQTATVDTPVGVAAGAGVGMVIDSLNPAAGVGSTLIQVPFRMPLTNGATLSISLNLAQQLVNQCTGLAALSAMPYMGINTNGGCTVSLYSGTEPANADASLGAAVQLVTFTVGAANIWAAAVAGAGSIAMNTTLTSNIALATGTAAFCRIVKTNTSTGQTYTIQGSAGAAGSGADFIVSSTAITAAAAAGTYSLTDCVISL